MRPNRLRTRITAPYTTCINRHKKQRKRRNNKEKRKEKDILRQKCHAKNINTLSCKIKPNRLTTFITNPRQHQKQHKQKIHTDNTDILIKTCHKTRVNPLFSRINLMYRNIIIISHNIILFYSNKDYINNKLANRKKLKAGKIYIYYTPKPSTKPNK